MLRAWNEVFEPGHCGVDPLVRGAAGLRRERTDEHRLADHLPTLLEHDEQRLHLLGECLQRPDQVRSLIQKTLTGSFKLKGLWDSLLYLCFHLLKNILYFPLLVLKGIYDNWKYVYFLQGA